LGTFNLKTGNVKKNRVQKDEVQKNRCTDMYIVHICTVQDIKTHRHTDGQTCRWAERQTEIETAGNYTVRQTDLQTYRQTDTLDRQTEQTDRTDKKDKQTNRQMDRQYMSVK
jgi:hypothetical protein